MEDHICSLSELSWIFLTYYPCWHQDSVPKRYHIHRSTIRISISAFKKKNTWSIFYKATFPSSKSPPLPGASGSPAPELSNFPFCLVSWSLKYGVLSAPLLSVLYYWSESPLPYLLLILPYCITSKRPRHSSEKGRTLLGWGQAWEGSKPVKPTLLSILRL